MNDLTGNADERTRQLAEVLQREEATNEWLHRQLTLALASWAESETVIDENIEARTDY
jgi:hypothetical protein